MNTLAVLRARRKREPVALANGRPARARWLQNLIGAAVTAACAAALIAGLYFNITQVTWFGHSLKPAWDGLFSSPLWDPFRHDYRDLGEPEWGYLALGIVIAKQATWGDRASRRRMIISPLLLIVLSVTGITAVSYVLYVLLPHLLGVATLDHWVLLAGTVAGGFIVGHAIRPIWTPVGSTINGNLMDRSVDRYCLRRMAFLRSVSAPEAKPPLWVRYPLAPLQMRERWVWQMEHNAQVTDHRTWLPAWLSRTLRALAVLLIAYLVVTGFIAHFWIGSGHSFPFLAPG